MSDLSWKLPVIGVLGLACLSSAVRAGETQAGDSRPGGHISFGAIYAAPHGDEEKFREDHGTWDDLTAGIRDFGYDIGGEGWNLEVDARAMQPTDYAAHVLLQKAETGFVEFDFSEFETYDDSSNLYYGFAPGTTDLGKDLVKTWREAKLTLGWTPPQKPHWSLTLERWEKFGSKSPLLGGSVTDGSMELNRYPVFEDLDQGRNRITLEMTHQVGEFDLSVRQIYREFEGHNEYAIPSYDSAGALEEVSRADYRPDNHGYLTRVDLEGDLVKDLLFAEFSALYSDLDTDTTYDENAFDAAGAPTAADNFNYNFTTNDHTGDQQLSRFNLQLTLTPNDVWTFFGGVGRKNEHNDHTSIKNVDAPHSARFGPPPVPAYWIPDGVVSRRAIYETDMQRDVWSYNLGGRVEPTHWLVGEVQTRLERGELDIDWQGTDVPIDFAASEDNFRWISEGSFDRNEFAASVTLKPTRSLKLIGRFERAAEDDDMNDRVDTVDGVPDIDGYPGVLDDTDRRSRAWSGIVEYRPFSALWATYKVKSERQDFLVQREPTEKIGEADSLIHSVSLNCMPADGLTLSCFGSHRNYEVKSEARNTPGFFAEQYDGDATTVGGNVNYALSENTTLTAGASRTYGDGEREHHFGNVFLGCSHKLTDTWSIDGRYGYVFFDEQDNGNIDDYRANSVSVGLTARF